MFLCSTSSVSSDFNKIFMKQEVNFIICRPYYIWDIVWNTQPSFLSHVTKYWIAIQDTFCCQLVEYENNISYLGLYLWQVSIRQNSARFYKIMDWFVSSESDWNQPATEANAGSLYTGKWYSHARVSIASQLQSNTENTNMAYCLVSSNSHTKICSQPSFFHQWQNFFHSPKRMEKEPV